MFVILKVFEVVPITIYTEIITLGFKVVEPPEPIFIAHSSCFKKSSEKPTFQQNESRTINK